MTNEEKDKKENRNNKLVYAVILVLVVGAVGFFGGMKYQESRQPEFMRNMPSGFRDQMGDRQINDRAVDIGFRPVSGKIIEVEDNSITVETQDGGSKIVIYSDNTTINKTTEGSIEDLQVEEQVIIIGKEGNEGTVIAETISIGGNYFRGGMPQGELPMEDN